MLEAIGEEAGRAGGAAELVVYDALDCKPCVGFRRCVDECVDGWLSAACGWMVGTIQWMEGELRSLSA
jgi:hypothetical protein